MATNQVKMDVLLLVVDEIYANIQQFIDSDTCCNYQFNINYCSALQGRINKS